MTFEEFFHYYNSVLSYATVFALGMCGGIILHRWAATGKWSLWP